MDKKLTKILLSRMGKAIKDFNMVEEGDRIAVGVSGGKDSYTLLYLLEEIRKKSPKKFEIVALNAHNGNKFYEWEKIEGFAKSVNVPFHLEKTSIIEIVMEKLRPNSYPCSFCARLRRAALYSAALNLNCNKLALGHHLDDAIETMLLNFFFQGSLKGMPPKLLAENRKIVVIRPLYYIPEPMIREFSEKMSYPIIDCACVISCDKQGERKEMKKVVEEISNRYPKARRSALNALKTVEPRYLADSKLYDFEKESLSEKTNGG
jgi:tRNA 2-thiocytidine biosynthesis protein TtcA